MRIATRIYSDVSQLAEIDARLALAPAALELCFERACCLEDLGWNAAALGGYCAVLARDPHHLGALTNAALMMRDAGELAGAHDLFAQAARWHPRMPGAQVNLGRVLFEQGEFDAAGDAYRAALALDPQAFAAHHHLALLADATGDAVGAQAHLARAFAGRAAWTRPYRGDGSPLRVVLLISARGGDVVTHPFLDDRVVETTLLVVEGVEPQTPIPPHDLVFNAIGDADRCGAALERARAIVARLATPIVNRPERVLATGRAANAARLGSLPGVRFARTEPLARAQVTAANLAAAGWTFPLLVRAPGHQTGRHFAYCGTPADLAPAVDQIPGDELFVIAFVDTRASDGCYRKYRVLSIGGTLFPVHLAISPDWKIHYFSSDMAERADHRAEEAHFLGGMRAALGAPAVAALEQIAVRLDLDYGGIDFTLDAAGNVVVFEANATMAIYRPDPSPQWAYRQPAYDAVVGAVRSLLMRRVGAAHGSARRSALAHEAQRG